MVITPKRLQKLILTTAAVAAAALVAGCSGGSSGDQPTEGADRSAPSYPTSVDFRKSPCGALHQPEIEAYLGVAVEPTEAGPETIPGTWWCSLKESGGDDSAPAVVLQITEHETPAQVAKGFRDKAVVTSQTCESLASVAGLESNHCEGGYDDISNVYNFWTFAGDTNILCGVNGPNAAQDSAAGLCSSVIARVG